MELDAFCAFQCLAAKAQFSLAGNYAKQGVCQFVAPGALKPRNSQNFTLVQLEADIVKPLARKVLCLHGNFGPDVVYMVFKLRIVQLAANHQFGNAVLVGVFKFSLCHQAAVAQHIVSVAYLEQLGHFVRDINKADALFFQAAP